MPTNFSLPNSGPDAPAGDQASVTVGLFGLLAFFRSKLFDRSFRPALSAMPAWLRYTALYLMLSSVIAGFVAAGAVYFAW